MRWPNWIDTRGTYNLRAIAPGLYLGGERAPGLTPKKGWRAIIDVYGDAVRRHGHAGYDTAGIVLHWPFDDGTPIPDGLLDAAVPIVQTGLHGGGPVLIHCQAGLSRSASVGYAMLRALDGLSHEDALARVQTPAYPNYPMTIVLASARAWVRRRRDGRGQAQRQGARRRTA